MNINLVVLTALNHFTLLFTVSLGDHTPLLHGLSYTRKVLTTNASSEKLFRNFSASFCGTATYLRGIQSWRLRLLMSLKNTQTDEWSYTSCRK